MNFVLSWSVGAFQLTFERFVPKTVTRILSCFRPDVELALAMEVLNLKLLEGIVIGVFWVFVSHGSLLQLFSFEETDEVVETLGGLGLKVFMGFHGFHLGVDFGEGRKKLFLVGLFVFVEFEQSFLKDEDDGFDAVVVDFLLLPGREA